MTEEEELGRAEEARMFLANPMFQDAVKTIEGAILSGIERSALKDSDMREKLCQQYILLKALVGQIQTFVETGKLAEATLKARGRG